MLLAAGTWERILVVDQQGNHLQTFEYFSNSPSSKSSKPEQLDCFIMVSGEVRVSVAQF
jgi:hypothetical protein